MLHHGFRFRGDEKHLASSYVGLRVDFISVQNRNVVARSNLNFIRFDNDSCTVFESD